MSPRTFVARSAAILSLAALGLAACESKTIVTPANNPLTIVVSPASVTLTAAGQKAQFVAVVSGGQDTQAKTYTWASSNAAVATVDANGVVTAVANGVATITATSTADANVKNAGLVTVSIPPVVPVTPPAAPTVSIQQVLDDGGNIVDLSNVARQINVALNVDVPAGNSVSKVEVLVDGATACSQSFTTGSTQVGVEAASAVTIICSINTAKLNGAVPQYANGSHQITARLVGSSGNVVASTTQTFVFNNVSVLAVTAAGSKTATDPNGLLWQDGVVTVVVTPTVFNSQQISTVTVGLENGPSKTVSVTNNAPVTVTFREDTTVAGGGTQNIEDATETVSVTGITAAGDMFQNGTVYTPTATFRYDNKGPVFTASPNLTTLAPNGFMNAGATLSVSKLNATVVDGGVDSNTNVIQVANAGSTTWTTVSSITDINEQPAGAKIMRIQSCDKLGNCTNSAATAAFGVDLTAPPILSVTADTINPAGPAVTLNLGLDNLSGYDLVNGSVLVTIVKDSADANGGDVTKCVNPVSGALSSVPSGGCTSTLQIPSTVTVPAAAGYGYYTITVQAQDLAGNKTVATTKVALVDLAAPTVNITSRGMTNNIPTMTASIKDNVDLGSYQPFGVFGGAIINGVTTLPMANATTVGAFGLPLTAVATPTATLPFGSVQPTLSSAPVQLAQVGFTAKDVAGNSSGMVLQPQIGQGTNVASTNIIATAVQAATTPLCQTGTTAACGNVTATSSALTVSIIFAAGSTTANPITAVYFYAENGGATATLLGSSTSAGFGVNTANQRVFTFTGSAAASALALGANNVFAIGVDANGNAVVLGSAAITTL